MELQEDSFGNFLAGMGATVRLLQRAKEQGFLIEAIVLYMSLIDALLRMGIILMNQLIDTRYIIEEKIIRQQ